MWIWNAYSSKDLAGMTQGGIAFGGWGISGVGGSYGAGGCGESRISGPIEKPTESLAITFGAGFGWGGGFLRADINTTVLLCF